MHRPSELTGDMRNAMVTGEPMLKDLLKTAQEFIWGVLKRAYWFIPALLSKPLDVFGLVAGTKLSIPSNFLPGLLALCFFIAAMLTYHELRRQKLATDRQLEEATRKRLEILFGSGEQFEQEQPVSDSHGSTGVRRLYRVGIRNVGGATISRAEAKLEVVNPATDILCPVPLRIMHDNPLHGQAHQVSFSLDPGQIQYVDVVMKDEWAGNTGHPFVIPHVVPDHPQQLTPQRYQLTIFAHGDGAVPARKNFIADLDGNRLRFREA